MFTPELKQWQLRHGATDAAMLELMQLFGAHDPGWTPVDGNASPEAIQQSKLRLTIAREGHKAWRNNVGGGVLEDGSFVRWGLANDSKKLNDAIKSGDLIGARRLLITPQMVGCVVAQFASWEVKKEGWRYTGTPREVAQLHWIEVVNGMGGYAKFSTGEL